MIRYLPLKDIALIDNINVIKKLNTIPVKKNNMRNPLTNNPTLKRPLNWKSEEKFPIRISKIRLEKIRINKNIKKTRKV